MNESKLFKILVKISRFVGAIFAFWLSAFIVVTLLGKIDKDPIVKVLSVIFVYIMILTLEHNIGLIYKWLFRTNGTK